MLIKAQNGKSVVDLSGRSLAVYGNAVIISDAVRSGIESIMNLGVYQTEQRAIEVLDEICAFYKGCNHERTIKGSDFAAVNGYVQNGIFEMPAE